MTPVIGYYETQTDHFWRFDSFGGIVCFVVKGVESKNSFRAD